MKKKKGHKDTKAPRFTKGFFFVLLRACPDDPVGRVLVTSWQIKRPQISILIFILGISLLLTSCEKDITLDLPQPEEQLVVEGRIEKGLPPIVMLTKNFSFFSQTNYTDFQNLQVHNAQVQVTVDGQTHDLTEFCLSNLPPNLKPLVADFLGFDPDSLPAIDLCAYVSFDITGETGKRYDLEIHYESYRVTASTVIPSINPIDSVWTRTNPDGPDSLVTLMVRFYEPDTTGNYYRYFTKVNDEPFYPGYFGSVWDDELTNGRMFTFNLDRGYARGTDIDFETYGLVEKGDTVVININAIDRGTYHFWNTLEDQLRSGGPFASPTYIQHNVEGGLGVWSGYGGVYNTLYVPK